MDRVVSRTDKLVKHPSKLDLDDYLPYLINRVGTIIAEQFGDEALAPHRLSIAMWRVMAALASRGSQRQIDLADLTSIEVSTLSRLVTRLVRMGLVTRTRSVNSSREVAVTLSAKGAALVARLIPIAGEYERAAIAGLTQEELAVLKRCLRRVYVNMKNRQFAAGRSERDERRGRLSPARALRRQPPQPL
jgi:MarR family transcriptional regulator, organic hydroperoxide resistance regulator